MEEDVRRSSHSTSTSQQKNLGVSFDTSLYTSLKFIPRNIEKMHVRFKENALNKFSEFFGKIFIP